MASEYFSYKFALSNQSDTIPSQKIFRIPAIWNFVCNTAFRSHQRNPQAKEESLMRGLSWTREQGRVEVRGDDIHFRLSVSQCLFIMYGKCVVNEAIRAKLAQSATNILHYNWHCCSIKARTNQSWLFFFLGLYECSISWRGTPIWNARGCSSSQLRV